MMNSQNIATYFMVIFALTLASPSISFGSVGKVAFVLGKVEKVTLNGETSRVTKKSEFAKSDIIKTTKNGQLMLLMSDNSKITIRPNSTFRIDDYSYTQNSKTDKSHYNLVKGGFRFVTGKMGKTNKSSYKLKTVVGTIGIRGTDFEANICDLNCTTDKGLFVNVVSGGISLKSNGGKIDIDPGKFGHIENQNTAPAVVVQLPDIMIISNSTKSDKAQSGSSGSTGSSEKYATPEEQMVSISLTQSNTEKQSTFNSLVKAGLSNNTILNGANNVGMEPATIVNSMLASGINSSQLIEMSMRRFPEHAANILTMGVATRAIDIKQANKLGNQTGVSPSKIESAITTGKLLRPPEVKKDKTGETDKTKTNKNINKQPKRDPIKRSEPKRVNPQLIPKDGNAGGPVPSPS